MRPTGNLVADIISRTSEIGLTITDAADVGTLTVINAASVDVSDTCPDCSAPGTKRDHVQRRLVDLQVVGFPHACTSGSPGFTCTNPNCGRYDHEPNI